ncbi:MAG: hypothetical protein QF464_00865 [Myxococcota bacterium]|nr:hypothetical protein [Myxococcota bacterium]
MSWRRSARALLASIALMVLAGCPGEAPGPLALGGSVDAPALRQALVPFGALRGAAPGDPIVVEGTIGKVCPAGCWFYLHSPDDLVYVDVLGDFVVPQDATGRTALVKARVDGEGGSRILQAQRVLLAPR